MKLEFTIHGIIKGGKNNYCIDPRSGRHYPNKKWAEWRDQVVREIRDIYPSHQSLLQSDCKMTVHYWSGDKRRRDITAMVDSIFHIIEKAELVEDDSLIKELHWYPFGYSKNDPKARIVIETI